MNQFKEYYQGTKTMRAIGATSCQKCLRTNDIDNIGDARHLSFFEMLGNFSFGGYSKADAIEWAYDFIASPDHLGLPADRLYMTVFEDDDEAIRLWHATIVGMMLRDGSNLMLACCVGRALCLRP